MLSVNAGAQRVQAAAPKQDGCVQRWREGASRWVSSQKSLFPHKKACFQKKLFPPKKARSQKKLVPKKACFQKKSPQSLSEHLQTSCELLLFAFCKAARLKINEEFRKNRSETSEENIQQVNSVFFSVFLLVPFVQMNDWIYYLLVQMIKLGSDVETVLRESVVQMEHVGEGRLCMFMSLIGDSKHLLKITKVMNFLILMKCCFFWFLISTVLRPRESLLLENVPYCDEPRKKSWRSYKMTSGIKKKTQVYLYSVTSTWNVKDQHLHVHVDVKINWNKLISPKHGTLEYKHLLLPMDLMHDIFFYQM